MATWLNANARYVSPTGLDGNDGLGWDSARQTIYAGLQALIEAGGGTLYVADGCNVGGPVPAQGIRLRFDSMPGGAPFFSALAAQGWLSLGCAIRIVGVGRSNGLGPFTEPVVASFSGGGSRSNPSIWVVGGTMMNGVVFENLQQASPFEVGARVGVDYDYNTDGSVRKIPVATASRTGTSTTYTLTLPTDLTAISAVRAGHVTTLQIPNPGLPWPPFRAGVPIRFAGSGLFAAGDYVITSATPPNTGDATWTITYSDPAGDAPLASISAAVQTHGLCPGELLDLTSTDPHFLGTQYMVDSFPTSPVDAATITVTDKFGSSGASGTAIGYLLHQERYAGGTTNVRFRNVYMSVDQFVATSGPSWDIGHTAAMRPEIWGGWINGHGNDPTEPRDERRMAGMYIYAGSATATPPVSAAYVHDICGNSGSIYFEAGRNGYACADVRTVMIEMNVPSLNLPALRVDGNQFSQMNADGVTTADSNPQGPSVVNNGVPWAAAQIRRSGYVTGPCVGGDSWYTPNDWIGAGTQNPWTVDHVTTWADGRITGKHPGAARGMGVLGARFQNLINPPSLWLSSAGVTITPGVLAPDGSMTAVDVTNTVGASGSVIVRQPGLAIFPVSPGDLVYVSGWLKNSATNVQVPGSMFQLQGYGLSWVGGSDMGAVNIPTPYIGTGWQFVQGYVEVASTTTTGTEIAVELFFANSGTITLWGLHASSVPASLDPNDRAEYLGTLRHQPIYLAPGMSGTMEGGKLIGHGGLGSATHYVVGTASKQITLGGANGNAVELFDENGSSLGVVLLQSFTVNP